MTDRDIEGTWKWLDGTPLDYTNWGPGYPHTDDTRDYLLKDFWSDGGWLDYNGHSVYDSVCKKPATK